jgi:tRNA U34 5-methylaminomethyl-2-thiouridine-forming methyltransferase MnmC
MTLFFFESCPEWNKIANLVMKIYFLMTKLTIQLSEDGSSTLFSNQFQTTYHSIHGALQESNHVYIQSGLAFFIDQNPTKTELAVLEIGLGTHLNALLTFSFLLNHETISVYYHALEKFPVPIQTLMELDYDLLLNDSRVKVNDFYECSWEEEHKISSQFRLVKQKMDWTDYETQKRYDVVYFDAFDPSIQPEMWTKEQFLKIANCMNTGGVLVTFSAKGQVRRDLQELGFKVERIPGPPGKREMIRATFEKK